MKTCSICKKEKDDSQFYKKRKTELSSYCKPCAAGVSLKARLEKKTAMFEYVGASCKLCGYDRCTDALDFHHLDPDKKDFSISKMGNMSLPKILKEIDKCIMVCANCHREIHAGLLQVA